MGGNDIVFTLASICQMATFHPSPLNTQLTPMWTKRHWKWSSPL